MLDHTREAICASICHGNQELCLDLCRELKLRSTKIYSSKQEALAYTHCRGHKEAVPKTSSHLDLGVRQTRVCETNAYVSLQGVKNDDLMFPPILYVLVSGLMVFFWEMVFSRSRSSQSKSKHTYARRHTHTHSNHTCMASKYG